MKRLIMIACALLLTACASNPTHPQDPLEPMNRAIFGFNDVADRTVAKPISEAYRFITPQPVRTGISNFFDNLRDVYSMANNTAQGKGERAITDLLRVSFNSTFGLFGLIDVATPMGLKSYKTTLGDTFAHYGWKNSSYLVLPLLGPSTIRDGTGTAISATLDPSLSLYKSHTIATGAAVLNAVNTREKLLGLEEVVNGAALDNYTYIRDGFLQIRAHQLGEMPAENKQGEDINIDDLVDSNSPAGESQVSPATPPADASAPASS